MVLPQIDKLISINKTINPLEQRLELLQISMEKWHSQVPLIRLARINLTSMEYKFVSNFEGYAKGTVALNNLILVPTRISSIDGTLFGGRRNWIYQDECLISYFTGFHNINATYGRPLYYEINNLNQLTSESCIGFLEERHISKFIDQCLLDIIEYVLQLKKNFNYPNLPIELFAGLDEKYSDLKQTLTDYYTGLTHGRIYR